MSNIMSEKLVDGIVPLGRTKQISHLPPWLPLLLLEYDCLDCGNKWLDDRWIIRHEEYK
jgi:hypothetical protein